jgi:hypothetical protein
MGPAMAASRLSSCPAPPKGSKRSASNASGDVLTTLGGSGTIRRDLPGDRRDRCRREVKAGILLDIWSVTRSTCDRGSIRAVDG